MSDSETDDVFAGGLELGQLEASEFGIEDPEFRGEEVQEDVDPTLECEVPILTIHHEEIIHDLSSGGMEPDTDQVWEDLLCDELCEGILPVLQDLQDEPDSVTVQSELQESTLRERVRDDDHDGGDDDGRRTDGRRT